MAFRSCFNRIVRLPLTLTTIAWVTIAYGKLNFEDVFRRELFYPPQAVIGAFEGLRLNEGDAYVSRWGSTAPKSTTFWSGDVRSSCLRSADVPSSDERGIRAASRIAFLVPFRIGDTVSWENQSHSIPLTIPGSLAARAMCTKLLVHDEWTCPSGVGSTCAADFASDAPCCEQSGTRVARRYQCPLDAPICTKYVRNERWGRCVQGETDNHVNSKPSPPNSFDCDYFARRVIAFHRYIHLCEVSACDDSLLFASLPWSDEITGTLPIEKMTQRTRDLGVDSISRLLCDAVLQIERGREKVESIRVLHRLDLHNPMPSLRSTCHVLTATAMYASMESAVSDILGLDPELFPLGPDPILRARSFDQLTIDRASTRDWSKHDVEMLSIVRANVARFLADAIPRYCVTTDRSRRAIVLEVGAQSFELLEKYKDSIVHETLDIDPHATATYTADITKDTGIDSGRFDCVVLTEVLEHTKQPFDAIAEVRRLLRPGGVLLISTPFSLRIHGPYPDAWRITEYGYKVLLAETFDFDVLEFSALERRGRPHFPIHHYAVARRPLHEDHEL